MRAVLVHDPLPPELEALIERRQALGQDRFDEVWEGVYHVTPGPNNAHAFVELEVVAVLRPYALAAGLYASSQFNLGEPDNYRVPDGGYHRQRPGGTRMSTAVIVVEVLSPGDETYDKFDFYAAHGVEEIFVVDPAQRKVAIYQRSSFAVDAGVSVVLGVDAATVVAGIDWP